MRDVLDAASKLLESNPPPPSRRSSRRRAAPMRDVFQSCWEQLKICSAGLVLGLGAAEILEKLVKRRQRSQCEGGCAFELTDEGRAPSRGD